MSQHGDTPGVAEKVVFNQNLADSAPRGAVWDEGERKPKKCWLSQVLIAGCRGEVFMFKFFLWFKLG